MYSRAKMRGRTEKISVKKKKKKKKQQTQALRY